MPQPSRCYHGAVLLCSIALATAITAQQAPPVFRAEAYVVKNQLRLNGRDDKPISGLTADDFSITIEHLSVPIHIEEEPQHPGNYLLSVNPPAELRDGKPHKIEVKVRVAGKWRTLPMKWKATFDKPQ